MKPVRLIVWAALLAALSWVGAKGTGPLPPLGALLDPAHGVWGAARAAELPRSAHGAIAGLGDDVQVIYDDRGVPHIFAKTVADAYRALGFVVARDRLFQLELQTRAAAGTLSELNPAALRLDKTARALGLAWSAEHKWASLDKRSDAALSLEAYAAGVNAYVAQMPSYEVPVEYRLLGRSPFHWEAKHALYFLSRMQQTLSYMPEELQRLRASVLVGRDAAAALYPLDAPMQEPIQPNGQHAPRFDVARVTPPGAPDTSSGADGRIVAALDAFDPDGQTTRANEALGSNNWAAGPSRTKSHHAMLAGDPHLDLSLPSIWYEAHLVVPGKLDVYGFTFAGMPSIIIGFNRAAAWTYTNTGADVVDFYRETVDDAATPTKYRLDGVWKPVERRIEEYRGPNGQLLATDTLYWTHRGPMRRLENSWLSMKWSAHDTTFGTANFDTFQGSQFVSSVAEYFQVMAPYPTPAQNMLVADTGGNIGIRSTGRYPTRAGRETGMDIHDGSTSANDWNGWWPVENYPQAINPAQGFLVSANQQPVDPKQSKGYLGGNWFSPFRAMQINALLRRDSALTPDAFQRMHTSGASARADLFVPEFLAAANRLAAAGKATGPLTEATKRLGAWNRIYAPESEEAVLFDLAMDELNARTWDEIAGRVEDATRRRPSLPSEQVLYELLQDPTSPWWDDKRTANVVETRDDILTTSLIAAFAAARAQFGEPAGGGWRYSRARPMNVYHLLRLAPFSALNLPTRSGPNTIAPRAGTDGTAGASERLIVELEPHHVKGWTVMPGGESGNPFSSRYMNRLAKWVAGTVDPVPFPETPDALPADKRSATLTLSPRP